MSEAKSELFTSAALERLSSVERLDTLMEVTNPKGWIALTAFALVILAVVVWSFVGQIPTVVESRGILLHDGGLFNISMATAGTISKIDVHEGDQVRAGQPIMNVAQPDLEHEVEDARANLERLMYARSGTTPLIVRNTELSLKSLAARRAQLEESVVSTREQATYLEQHLARQQELQRLGLITAAIVQNAQQQLADARANLKIFASQIAEADAQEMSVKTSEMTKTFGNDSEIRRAEQQLRLAEAQLDRASVVRSPYTGRVTNILVDEGQHILAGTDVAAVELSDRPLETYAFVGNHSTDIRPGMPVQIEVDGIDKHDYGYLLGTVDRCSRLPLSTTEMMRLLHNDLFVRELSAQGAPIMVVIDLIPDSASPSGYRWSTSRGAPISIASGRRLTARIVTEHRRPIQFVIPRLRGWIGI